MDLHNGLKRPFLASCLALCEAGCAMSATPAGHSAADATSSRAASAALSTAAPLQGWKLSVSPGENGTYRIHVADRSGREWQVIEGPEGKPPFDAGNVVRLEDLTGDGRPDIIARSLLAGTSALTSESIYVYDAASDRFLDAQPFENEGEVTRTAPGCIAVGHRNPDNTTYSKDTCCWKDAWLPVKNGD